MRRHRFFGGLSIGIGFMAVAALPLPAAAVILSRFGTPTIDGVVGLFEWVNAGAVQFSANLPGGGTAPATLRVMNDASNLYLSVTVDHGSGSAAVTCEFDSDQSGTGSDGDDGIGVNFDGSTIDNVRVGQNFPTDQADGGTRDVVGAVQQDVAKTSFEVSHPLASGDGNRDIAVGPNDLLPFFLELSIFEPGPGFTLVPPFGYDVIEIAPEPAGGALAATGVLATALLALHRARPR